MYLNAILASKGLNIGHTQACSDEGPEAWGAACGPHSPGLFPVQVISRECLAPPVCSRPSWLCAAPPQSVGGYYLSWQHDMGSGWEQCEEANGCRWGALDRESGPGPDPPAPPGLHLFIEEGNSPAGPGRCRCCRVCQGDWRVRVWKGQVGQPWARWANKGGRKTFPLLSFKPPWVAPQPKVRIRLGDLIVTSWLSWVVQIFFIFPKQLLFLSGEILSVYICICICIYI